VAIRTQSDQQQIPGFNSPGKICDRYIMTTPPTPYAGNKQLPGMIWNGLPQCCGRGTKLLEIIDGHNIFSPQVALTKLLHHRNIKPQFISD
jgi:hypothetical protein